MLNQLPNNPLLLWAKFTNLSMVYFQKGIISQYEGDTIPQDPHPPAPTQGSLCFC